MVVFDGRPGGPTPPIGIPHSWWMALAETEDDFADDAEYGRPLTSWDSPRGQGWTAPRHLGHVSDPCAQRRFIHQSFRVVYRACL